MFYIECAATYACAFMHACIPRARTHVHTHTHAAMTTVCVHTFTDEQVLGS